MARQKFATLDALRGVAALAVMLFHVSGPLHALAPAGYLAVDLFFLMSGFVIAASYEERLLNGWSVGGFMLVRLKRLWPLYALGTVLGLACFAAVRLLRPDQAFAFPPASIPQVFVMSLLLLPQFVAYGGPAFAFNSASWSLSVEVFGNLAYAALARSLRMPVLILFAGAGFLGLVIVAFRTGSLDAGVTYGNLTAGALRFLFSFSAGVLLQRWHAAGRLPRLPLPVWLPPAAAAATFTAFGGSGGVRDLVVVALVFPAILIGALANPASPRAVRLFTAAGIVSYPLYVLHPPLLDAVRVLMGCGYSLGVSLALLLAIVGLAILADRYFDRPLQNLLRRRQAAQPTGAV